MIWANSTSPHAGVPAAEFYSWQPFGTWILYAEIVLFGLLPALLYLNTRVRSSSIGLLASALLTCGGIVLNRFVMTIQTLALPTLRFDAFMLYQPSWQEVATFLAAIAYGVLVFSISFRYLRLFPQERELAVQETNQVPERIAV